MLLAPEFGAQGLIPIVATDAATGEVLHAHMNEAALLKTPNEVGDELF